MNGKSEKAFLQGYDKTGWECIYKNEFMTLKTGVLSLPIPLHYLGYKSEPPMPISDLSKTHSFLFYLVNLTTVLIASFGF